MSVDAALEVIAELLLDVSRKRHDALALGLLEQGFEMLLHDMVKRRLLWPPWTVTRCAFRRTKCDDTRGQARSDPRPSLRKKCALVSECVFPLNLAGISPRTRGDPFLATAPPRARTELVRAFPLYVLGPNRLLDPTMRSASRLNISFDCKIRTKQSVLKSSMAATLPLDPCRAPLVTLALAQTFGEALERRSRS